MIKYKLKCKSSYCSEQNDFDGWFQNIEAFEKQKSLSLINCPICGSDNVVKSLTTPSLKITKSDNSIQKKETKDLEQEKINQNISRNENLKNITTLLRTLKKEIQKSSTFVGKDFVNQARSMKQGKIKEKPIHGHGTNKEIEELKDEGINVINVPWIPDDH